MNKILVIDDEPQVRSSLRKLLEHEGYIVDEATNGKEGLKNYSHTPADLIITDLIMPEKEGLETIKELKAVDPNVKIIAISGGGINKPDGYLNLAEKIFNVKTFEKPIRNQEFLRAIQEVLME